jgi:hypothetical protein
MFLLQPKFQNYLFDLHKYAAMLDPLGSFRVDYSDLYNTGFAAESLGEYELERSF